MISDITYRAIVGDRNFVRFWAATSSAELGYGLFELAIAWLAITTTHSPLFTGTVLLIEFATYSLTFLVGPVIDAGSDKRKFILWVFPVQAVLAISLTLAVLAHAVSIPVILVVVFLMALLWDFPWVAATVILPLILDRRKLLRANSLMLSVGGGSSVLINAMGGIVLAAVGVGGASAIYAATFLVATILMLTVKVPKTQGEERNGKNLPADLKEGWGLLMKGERRDLRTLFFLSGIQGFFAIAPFLLIIIISATYIGGANGRLTLGLMNATFFAGGFAGNLIYGRINPSGSLGKSITLATLVEGVLIVLSPATLSYLPAAYLLWFLVGCFDPLFYTGYNAYVQATVSKDMVGRMKGNIYLLRGIGRGAGNLALGALIAFAGFAAGSFVFGAALALTALAVILAAPSVWKAGYN